MYLYKIAKERKRERKDFSRQAFINGLVNPIPIANAISSTGAGISTGHPMVGALIGPAAINGAIAKDEGVSYLPETVAGGAIGGTLVGGVAGPFLATAFGDVYPKSALIGGALAAGALGGAVTSGIHYGLGRLFGNDNKK